MAKPLVVFIVFVLVCLPSSAFGWKTLKTDHFTIFYKPGYETRAWEFLRTLEHYRPRLEALTGNSIFHLPVIIEDAGTMSNGMADPINCVIFLYTYPPSGSSLGAPENWATDVAVHEYTHMLHLTKVEGFASALTTLFGSLFSPNMYSLGWAVEGITVYSESQVSKYQGRLNDGYYSAYIAARIKDKRFPSILEAAYPPLEYPYGDGIYNYGGAFFNYLSRAYGEDKFAQFFREYGSWLPVFMFGSSAKQVYGKSFPQLWKEWQEYESNRFKDFRMEGKRVTHHGWWTSDLILSGNKLYYTKVYAKKVGAFNGYSFAKIVERDIQTGKEKTLVSTTSSFTTSIKLRNGKLYYASAEIKPGYPNVSSSGYGIYSVLHEEDLAEGKDEVILRDGIRDFEILYDGNILYSKDRKDSFGSELYKYDRVTGEKQLLFKSDYLVDRIVNEGEKIIVSARKDWENFSLYALSLETHELIPIVHTPYFEGHQSLCGDKLLFTANYDKVYSIYCYEFSSGKLYRLTENGYATYPGYDEKGQKLYYIGLNSYGNDIYVKDAVWKEFQLAGYPFTTPPNMSVDASRVNKGGYLDNLKTMTPKLRLPLFWYDEERGESRLGIFLMGQDVLGHFPYSGELWYDFKLRKPRHDIMLGFNLLPPFVMSISSSDIEERQIKIDMQYPFITRLSPGLSNLSIGLSDNIFEDFNRHEISPYLGIGFRFPTTRSLFKLSLPCERKSMFSDVNRTALIGDIGFAQYVKVGAVNIKIKGVYDPDSTYDPTKDDPEDSPFPKIRGYDDPLDAKIGVSFSVDFSAPILPVRRGIWFPPYIFFEDICAGVFSDGTIPKGAKNPQLSTGLEIHLETNLVAWLPLDIGARFYVNRDRKFGIAPIVSAGVGALYRSPFLSFARTSLFRKIFLP